MKTPASVRTTVQIFARAPEPGRAKTRLIPALGAEGAAELQARMTERMVHAARSASVGDVELWCSPSPDHPAFGQFAEQSGVTCRPQTGASLGERMCDAHDEAFARRCAPIIVGTDCPGLTSAVLRAAADALRHHDTVIVPAEDGGYVLIGFSTPCREAFDAVDWGTVRVYAQTMRRLRAARRTVCALPKLWDVDRPADWSRLVLEHPDLAAQVRCACTARAPDGAASAGLEVAGNRPHLGENRGTD